MTPQQALGHFAELAALVDSAILRKIKQAENLPDTPEFAEHRELLKQLRAVHEKIDQLIPYPKTKGARVRGVVLKYNEEYACAMVRLVTGEFVELSLTAYQGNRGGARRPWAGTEVELLFTRETPPQVLLGYEV